MHADLDRCQKERKILQTCNLRSFRHAYIRARHHRRLYSRVRYHGNLFCYVFLCNQARSVRIVAAVPLFSVAMSRCHTRMVANACVLTWVNIFYSQMHAGLINFLISDDVDAVRLREKVVFKIVPMINPDGVVAGNYRCGSMGHDLNRCYQTPKKWCQPEVHAIKKLLAELSQNCPKRLLFYLDLHAHTTSLSSFLYGNWYKNEGKMVSQWVFPHLMAAHADDFSLDNTDFNSHKAKAGTGRRALMQVMHSTAQIYTLEVSFYGYPHPGDPTITVPYSEERYRQLGAAVGRALADYYS
eukprot:m.333446 g.333446  ORF g.333446 m.333446 type:complete len:298 (-) comp20504_c0_seq23:749-1642(-)